MPTKVPLSNLINASSIPGDIAFLENGVETILDLSNLQYYDKDPNDTTGRAHKVTESAKKDEVEHKLVLVTKERHHKIFGSELKLVLCKGANDTSEFPTIVNWKWPLKPYLDKFDLQGFAYTPEAFLDIFLLLADIKSMEEFYAELMEAFFGESDAGYEGFIKEIETTIAAYNDNSADIDKEVKTILAQVKIILAEVKDLLKNKWTIKKIVAEIKNPSANTNLQIKKIEAAAKSIEKSVEKLQKLLKINNKTIDIYKDTVLALFKNIKDDGVQLRFVPLKNALN